MNRIVNIAAYKLDRLLGLNIVPVAVKRRFRGSSAAFSWWVEDIQMMEKERWQKGIEPPDGDAWNEQMWRVRVFNKLSQNTDPNLGNVLIDRDWKIWLVDYTRAFRIQTDLLNAESLTNIERGLLERLRTLDSESVANALKDSLGKRELRSLLERRDKIVGYYFRQLNPLSEFAVRSRGAPFRLEFENLGERAGLADVLGYGFEWFSLDNATGELTPLGEASGEARHPALEIPSADAEFLMVRIRTRAAEPAWDKAVDVFLRNDRTPPSLVGIEREE